MFHGTALQGLSAGLVSNVSPRSSGNSETAGNGNGRMEIEECTGAVCIEKSLHLVMFAPLSSLINPSLQRPLISLLTEQLSAVVLHGLSISCRVNAAEQA